MIFVLDNYDSFTYNLVQYLGELGSEVIVRRNDEVTVSDVETLRPEKILVSPGPCTPAEARISIELIRHFAYPRRLSWTSSHRRSVRREGRTRQEADARQDQRHRT